MDLGTKFFLASWGMALLGGAGLLAEIGGGRAGCLLGVLIGPPLLGAGCLGNLAATGMGIADLIQRKTFRWWLPFSVLGSLGALWFGWMLIHL